MDTSEYSKDIATLKKVLKNLNQTIDTLYKKVKKAKKEMEPQNTLPISIPIRILTKESAEKTTQTDMACNEQSSVGQVELVTVPKVTYIDSSEQIINNAFVETKTNSEKSKEINVSNNKNPKTVEQNEIITINDKPTIIDDNIMKKIIDSSQNYKEFLNNFSKSAGKLFKSGKCYTKEDLNRLSRIINEIIMLFLNEDSSDQINIEETSSENKSNDNNKNTEIEINLQAIKQERKDIDDDDKTTVVSEVIDRAEINTAPEEQIEVSQTERVQQNKQQTQHKANDKYNYIEQYNSYMMQNKNSYTMTKETRPPCPPSTTPRLQQYQPYDNQNSYCNQESKNKNIRYPYKRNHRQTPYPRCQILMNQAQIQQLPQNHQAYAQYPQYAHQPNPQMQAQMQGIYSQNTPYH